MLLPPYTERAKRGRGPPRDVQQGANYWDVLRNTADLAIFH